MKSRFVNRPHTLYVTITTSALLLTSQLHGAVILGTASGTDLQVAVSALSLVTLAVGPLAHAQISSSAPGSQVDGVLSVNELKIIGGVSAENGTNNALVASAFSNVTGIATTGLTIGAATTHNLGITLIPGILFTPDFLNITSTTIGSTSTSSGQYSALTSVGTSVLEGLMISVSGVNITIPLNPAPNTLLVLAGLGLDSNIVANLSIMLNEQLPTGNGTDLSGITTNALHISIKALNLSLVTGLNGDIVVGKSSSSLAAIPEPSALVMVAGGVAGCMISRRRKN